jgi:hypothetical protein
VDLIRRYRAAIVVAVLLIAGSGLLAALVAVPGMLVRHDLGGRTIGTVDYLKAVSDARTLALQLLGGLAVSVGAYATWRRLRVNEDELRTTRDGPVTERFTRAIEQLGSDSANIRIGAVFALGRIAHNSPTDRDAVVATLSAFVPGHSPWPPQRPGQPSHDADLHDLPTLATRANDVQSAVAVLGGLPSSVDGERIRLPNSDLRLARMYQLTFDYAALSGANLAGARLWGSSLVRADLGHASFRGSDFTSADLTGAILWGAGLTGADLTGATLDGAQIDAHTVWPDGFDPGTHRLVTVTDDGRPRYRDRAIQIAKTVTPSKPSPRRSRHAH